MQCLHILNQTTSKELKEYLQTFIDGKTFILAEDEDTQNCLKAKGINDFYIYLVGQKIYILNYFVIDNVYSRNE